MNRIKYTAMQYKIILIALFFGCPLLAEAEGSVVSLDRTIENRIFSLGSSVDVKYSAEVKRRIKQYTVKQRSMSEILLGRSSIYFPLFEDVFKEKGLPQDLKYLSVVESGLRPIATSRSGAAGLWQHTIQIFLQRCRKKSLWIRFMSAQWQCRLIPMPAHPVQGTVIGDSVCQHFRPVALQISKGVQTGTG